jgi:hypothetical protein
MTTYSDSIVLEWRTSKSGKSVLVVPAGKVQPGDIIRSVHRAVMERAPNWPGAREIKPGVWEAVVETRIASIGQAFSYRGYYMDAEDALSVYGARQSVRIPTQSAQYAYPEQQK